jgi:hypothetical protein
MDITLDTTVCDILHKYPEAVKVFLEHGVDVPLECDESILDTPLEICDSMCHIDDISALMRDLQKFVEAS